MAPGWISVAVRITISVEASSFELVLPLTVSGDRSPGCERSACSLHVSGFVRSAVNPLETAFRSRPLLHHRPFPLILRSAPGLITAGIGRSSWNAPSGIPAAMEPFLSDMCVLVASADITADTQHSLARKGSRSLNGSERILSSTVLHRRYAHARRIGHLSCASPPIPSHWSSKSSGFDDVIAATLHRSSPRRAHPGDH